MIVMTPKSLLRLPEAKSSFDEMAEGTSFRRLIPESGPAVDNAEHVRKLLFCSGKVYYDLAKERLQKNCIQDIAIARVEQVRRNSSYFTDHGNWPDAFGFCVIMASNAHLCSGSNTGVVACLPFRE